MALKQSLELRDASGRLVLVQYCDSERSPRGPNGKLKLRANPFTLFKLRETMFVNEGSGYRPKPYDIGQWGYGEEDYRSERDRTAQIARAKLVGRLHYGDASLGVSLAGWRSSVSMVATRARDIVKILQRIKSKERMRELQRDASRFKGMSLKEIARKGADSHLELIFGWIPLYSDMQAAMAVLCGDIPYGFSSARHKIVIDKTWDIEKNISRKTELLSVSSVWATQVVVENQNAWLLNRLGLLNPAVVIWDIIPWSFLVNLFVNVNSVLKSYTDFVGLSFPNSSVTTTVRGTRSHSYLKNPYYPGITANGSTHTLLWKSRYLGTPPRPTLEFRTPELNLGLLAMSGSLLVQQSRRLEKLFHS